MLMISISERCIQSVFCVLRYHLGVIKALTEKGLLPGVIAGSSAGSIVASIVAVNTDEELLQVFEEDLSINLFDGSESNFTKFQR